MKFYVVTVEKSKNVCLKKKKKSYGLIFSFILPHPKRAYEMHMVDFSSNFLYTIERNMSGRNKMRAIY